MKMTTISLNNKQRKIVKEIPSVSDSSGIYFYTLKSHYDTDFIAILETIIGLNDNILSKWLNITPRTFRNYKNSSELVLKDNTKEHIILILSLYKHGIDVFGDVKKFETWLSQKNILLDNRTPSNFLETISGIKFIDDRLTAIEFGENV